MTISPSSFVSRLSMALFSFALIFGSTAFAVGVFNTPETGYILCVNTKTSVVTFPGTSKCPKGTTRLQMGAQGPAGAKGDQGESGLAGAIGAQGPVGIMGSAGATGPGGVAGATGPSGVNGSSLLTGVGEPKNLLGNNGDTYIDKNAAYIYGPKSSGLWGNPTSFGGATGATGPVGPAGPATEATLRFVSDFAEGPLPSSGTLPVYDGTNYTTVLSLTAPSAGTYWVSLYTETWTNSSQATADLSVCTLRRNGSNFFYSANHHQHFMQRLFNLTEGEVITLACAQNTGDEGEAYNSSGYLLRVAD